MTGADSDTAPITVVINGRPHRGQAGLTVADAVSLVSAMAGRGIAVAVNGEVVRRADWQARRLAPGDQVEVLTAVQGG
jgi:sulfur carrier protein